MVQMLGWLRADAAWGLPLEAAPTRRVGHTVAEELDRHLTAKVLVLGNEHFAHST
jgi:hypothetical protein